MESLEWVFSLFCGIQSNRSWMPENLSSHSHCHQHVTCVLSLPYPSVLSRTHKCQSHSFLLLSPWEEWDHSTSQSVSAEEPFTPVAIGVLVLQAPSMQQETRESQWGRLWPSPLRHSDFAQYPYQKQRIITSFNYTVFYFIPTCFTCEVLTWEYVALHAEQ